MNMRMSKKKVISHILNVIIVALIAVCFLYSMMAVRKYAKDNCFERIEETATQISHMFEHAMDERMDKLTIFADILAANSENPDELLQKYMENFCRTQYFSAVCIHRRNGKITAYGNHPQGVIPIMDFEEEAARLPYISSVFSNGDQAEDRFIYQAVPIIRDGEILAVLHGYMSLDIMPDFIASGAYSGKCQFYVVDGDTGDFLMDEYHGKLDNLFDGSMGKRETKNGYDIDQMRDDVRLGESGFFVFKSLKTGDWYYTYYMPMGINNWSMQLTIDETTAFATYNDVNKILVVLMISVIILTVIHVVILMSQNAYSNRQDRQRLHKTGYINAVQRSLISAHNNPDFVDQALKTVAGEMDAETVILLTFSEKVVSNAQYWPSKDKAQAMKMIGRNIQDEFPMLFDLLSSNTSVYYDKDDPVLSISESAVRIFKNLEVSNMALVPITDTVGALKGAIAAVNMKEKQDIEMLECVTYDFFMAITNLENHIIIRNMGTMDYLTGIKNRNSYESEIGGYADLNGESLWCIFIDVNGLHEVNNTQGHKAGDIMLCSVADAVKRRFGEKYTYRLGGDEFVSFAVDSSYEECLKKKKAIAAELAVKGYYVSIGFCGILKNEDGIFDVEHVVSDAESMMYQEKWEYYQANHIPSERGRMSSVQENN